MSEVGVPKCAQCLETRIRGKAISLVFFILIALLSSMVAIGMCSVGVKPIVGISFGVALLFLCSYTFHCHRLWIGDWNYSFTICEQSKLTEHLHRYHPADASKDSNPIPWFPFTRSDLPRYVKGPIIKVLVEGYLRRGRSQILGARMQFSNWSHASRLLSNGQIILINKSGRRSHPMSLGEAGQFLQRYPDYGAYLKEREHCFRSYPGAHVGLRVLSIFLHQMHQRHNSRVALRAHDLVHLLLAKMNQGEDGVFHGHWQYVDPSIKLAELLAVLDAEQTGTSGIVTEPEARAKEPATA